jgi:hypothetical protein
MTKRTTFRWLIPVILLFLSTAAKAQHIELTPFAGGTFAAGINNYSTYYTRAQIAGSWHWGGALDFYPNKYFSITLSYQEQPTTASLYGKSGYSTLSAPMHVSYILVGGNRYFGEDKVQGFGGLGLGMAILAASGYATADKFAVDLHAGVKILASDHVGIRFQIQLDAPVDGGGFGVGVGTGGAAVGVTTYSSIWQFGGNVGIIFRFGQK